MAVGAKDRAKAKQLFKEAAEAGDESAKAALERMEQEDNKATQSDSASQQK